MILLFEDTHFLTLLLKLSLINLQTFANLSKEITFYLKVNLFQHEWNYTILYIYSPLVFTFLLVSLLFCWLLCLGLSLFALAHLLSWRQPDLTPENSRHLGHCYSMLRNVLVLVLVSSSHPCSHVLLVGKNSSENTEERLGIDEAPSQHFICFSVNNPSREY